MHFARTDRYSGNGVNLAHNKFTDAINHLSVEILRQQQQKQLEIQNGNKFYNYKIATNNNNKFDIVTVWRQQQQEQFTKKS